MSRGVALARDRGTDRGGAGMGAHPLAQPVTTLPGYPLTEQARDAMMGGADGTLTAPRVDRRGIHCRTYGPVLPSSLGPWPSNAYSGAVARQNGCSPTPLDPPLLRLFLSNNSKPVEVGR